MTRPQAPHVGGWMRWRVTASRASFASALGQLKAECLRDLWNMPLRLRPISTHSHFDIQSRSFGWFWRQPVASDLGERSDGRGLSSLTQRSCSWPDDG